MQEEERRGKIEEAKGVLSKLDPELSIMAIRQAEVDFDEVNEIKDFLGKCNPEAVQYAIAELQQEVMTQEINAIKEQLGAYDLEVLKAAAVELGFAAKVGYCINGIKCQGKCVQVMTVRCMQDMYVAVKQDQLVSPVLMESSFGRAFVKALAQAQQFKEL